MQAVYEFLGGIEENPIELTQEEIKETLSLPIGNDGVGNCEQLLESAGVLERLIASQNMASVRIDSDLPTLVDLLPKQARTQRKVLQSVERLVGPRRQELVQFNVRDLTVHDEFDLKSISPALRELNKLEAFTYVPPFRGRAIRMINHDLPFDKLEIDFEALERRKAQEYEKLDLVIRFALSGSCRQREILRYFGEDRRQTVWSLRQLPAARTISPRPVGGSRGQVSPLPLGEGQGVRAAGAQSLTTPDEKVDGKVLEAVRIVLSGVARTQAAIPLRQEPHRPDALRLEQRQDHEAAAEPAQHVRIAATPQADGSVADYRRADCPAVREQVDLEQFRPVLELTEFGDEVMKGKASLSCALPVPLDLLWKLRGEKPRPVSAPAAALPLPSAFSPDPEILKSLRQWRAEIADEAGVPFHYILSNETLAALARSRPRTRDELLAIKGIGPVKVERYGRALLEIVGEADEEKAEGGRRKAELENDAEAPNCEPYSPALSPLSPSPPSPVPLPPSPHAPHYWTQRLLAAGFTVDECAAIRGLTVEVVREHARRAEKEKEL